MNTFENWEVYEAQSFCESVRDGTHDSPKFVDDGHPLITSKAIKDGRLVIETAGLISEQDFRAVNQRSKVDQWDILYTMIGTLGEPYLEQSDDINYAIKNVGLFKCGSELKGKWLYYWLSNPVEKRRILQLRRGASQQYLPLGTLRSLEIRFPRDEAVATKIVETASAYDDLIENNRRRIVLLEEAARQLYKEWFVRFRFPSHEHTPIIDGVPEGWETLSVSDLGEVVTGKTPSKKSPENYGNDIPFIKTPDMHGNLLVCTTEESLSERGAATQTNKLLPARSILVSCIGTVGVTAMNSCAAQTNQQINAVVPKSDSLKYFGFFALAALKPRLEGMGGGATMANVNKTKFSGLPILLPSKGLIDEFAELVRPSFDQIEKLTQYNQALTKARDLLLPRLMNGEIAV